jgi:anionic cell wall polymer biosynthesis LytR-Cps2A-Psr (LCP) family protein
MLKNVLLVFISLFIITTVAGSIFLFHQLTSIIVKPNKPHVIVALATPSPTPDPLAPYSILLMGYGGGAHDGGLLTDSMIVARIEPHTDSVTLISIPRDIWVPIPVSSTETKYAKINSAYAVGSDDRKYPNKSDEFKGPAGGGQMAKSVVSQVVGFNIDYFVSLDFKGFIKFIDLLGGVKVPVAKTFTDPMYPIEKDIVDNCGKSDDDIKALTATMSGEKLEQQFPCRYESLHFDKGLQLMTGETALKFARSRHSIEDGGDFNRANRQRVLIEAVKNQVISLNFIDKIIPTIKTLSYNLKTDIDLAKLQSLISQSAVLSKYKINSIALTDQNVLVDDKSSDGQFILVPKAGPDSWDQTHQYILNPSILTPTLTQTNR